MPPRPTHTQSTYPETHNVTLFENTVFENVISSGRPGEIILDSRQALNSMTGILIREEREREKWKCEDRFWSLEIGVILPKAKKCLGPPVTGKGKTGFSLEPSEKGWPS